MKRIIVVSMVLIMAFSLVSCKNNTSSDNIQQSNQDVNLTVNINSSNESGSEKDPGNDDASGSNNGAVVPVATGPVKQASKSFDLEQYARYYTSCSRPVKFLDEWDSMADLIKNGDGGIVSGYKWFYDKYSSREDSEGYILIDAEVKKDIKSLAKSRGYASDWKEFILYREGDKTGYTGYVGKDDYVYIKCGKNSGYDNSLVYYTSCSRGIKFLDRWDSMEDVINYGDSDMVSDYQSFFDKYSSKENADGYIEVTEDVLKDIKDLAASRGYKDDWMEFLLIKKNKDEARASIDSSEDAYSTSEAGMEALAAYNNMLSRKSFERDVYSAYEEIWESDQCSFFTAFLDDDDIPELFVVGPSGHANGYGQVYTFSGGQVEPMIRLSDPESADGVYERTGWYTDFAMWQGYGGSVTMSIYGEDPLSIGYVPDGDGGVVFSGYSIGSRDCSEDEYYNALSEATGGKAITFYEFVANTEENRNTYLGGNALSSPAEENSHSNTITKDFLYNKVWEWEGFGDAVYLVEFMRNDVYLLSIKGMDYGYEEGKYSIKDGKLIIGEDYIGKDPADFEGYVPGYKFGSGVYVIEDSSTLVSESELPNRSNPSNSNVYTFSLG